MIEVPAVEVPAAAVAAAGCWWLLVAAGGCWWLLLLLMAAGGASCSFEAFNLVTLRPFPWLWDKREEKELLTKSLLSTFCVLFPMFLKPL